MIKIIEFMYMFLFYMQRIQSNPVTNIPLELFACVWLFLLEQDSSLHQKLHIFSGFLFSPVPLRRIPQKLFSQPAHVKPINKCAMYCPKIKSKKQYHFICCRIQDLIIRWCLIEKHISPCHTKQHPLKSEKFRFRDDTTNKSHTRSSRRFISHLLKIRKPT